MFVKVARPPLFAEIAAAFNLAGRRGIIYAWGDCIYAPDGGPFSAELRAHEAVHGQRQGTDVEGWWRRYIADPTFRRDEEIPAHIAEYQEFCRNNRNGPVRNSRRLYLHHVASRLASPLYGRLIKYDDARKLLKEAVQI